MTGSPSTSSARRIFLGWDAPALPRAAKRIAEEYAGSGELDLRRVVVVTPAARAGRRLGELLLDEAEARGVPLTPPRIITMGRLPELLYQPPRSLADSTATRHAFARALQGLDPNLLGGLFPSLPRSMSGWMALAGLVETLHREVGAEGWDFQGVGLAFQRGFPYDDSARWEVLARIQERYFSLLDAADLGDRDTERRLALEGGRLNPPGDVWLVGVVELPRVVRQMVAALSEAVTALIHAPEEVRDGFDDLGCVAPAFWTLARIELAEERIRVVQRPPQQADGVAEILRGFGGRYEPEDVVVGIPDPELVPYVERGLSMVEVPHRFAGGVRLEDSGPVRLLEALAEYLNGRHFQAFGALVRHPDLFDLAKEIVGIVGEEGGEGVEVTGPLTIADHFQSRHLQASVEGPLPGGDQYAQRMRGLVGRLEEALGLEALEGARPLSEWMQDILEILVRVYGREPLDLGKRSVRQMVEAHKRIKEGAGRLALLPGPLDVVVEGAEGVSLLLAELRGETIPPDPEEHAVELLGWLELPLDDAPAVILTGVNDRHIPESAGADPFLPGALRTHLGIPDDSARYARDAYLLSALTQSRDEVHLVAGRLTAAGDPLRPSRLLFAASEECVARRVRRFLGEEERGDLPSPALKKNECSENEDAHPGADVAESRFRSPPVDPIPALDSLPRIRVTDFATYLNDPYRYALTRVLRLEPLDDEAREMAGMTFGSLAHLVLERFGASEEAASPDPQVVAKKLDGLLDGAVHEEFGRRPLPAVKVQAEQLRARLRHFARWQAGWVEEGWRIVAVEAQPGDGVRFEVDGESVLLRGKIDRIDHNAETGEWAIFDYKTSDAGAIPEKTHRKGVGENKRWVDLQLPLYRVLLAGIVGEDESPVIPPSDQAGVKLGYILLPKKLEEVGASFAEWSADELDGAEAAAMEVIRALRERPFAYDPSTRSFPNDPLDSLLGRKELPKADEDDDGGEG